MNCPECDRPIVGDTCKCGFKMPNAKPIQVQRQSKSIQVSAHDSEYTKEARAIHAKAGKISGLDLSGLMFEMDKKYPGKGWFAQACEVLKNFNDRNGIQTPHEFLPAKSRGIPGKPCAATGCHNPGTRSTSIGKNDLWFCSDHA